MNIITQEALLKSLHLLTAAILSTPTKGAASIIQKIRFRYNPTTSIRKDGELLSPKQGILPYSIRLK
jgi:hypothetical protein